MMRLVVRMVVAVVGACLVVASAVNVYGDDAEVRSLAEAVACPRGCTKAISVAVSRTPFFETVSYSGTNETVTVHCARAAIFVGPYSCERE